MLIRVRLAVNLLRVDAVDYGLMSSTSGQSKGSAPSDTVLSALLAEEKNSCRVGEQT